METSITYDRKKKGKPLNHCEKISDISKLLYARYLQCVAKDSASSKMDGQLVLIMRKVMRKFFLKKFLVSDREGMRFLFKCTLRYNRRNHLAEIMLTRRRIVGIEGDELGVPNVDECAAVFSNIVDFIRTVANQLTPGQVPVRWEIDVLR